MALETATYINGLVATNPAGGDAIAQADDHLRLIKATIKATFPNITGAVSASHTDLNTRLMPSGGIIMWSGASSAIPSGWVLCDGNNSTPDLRGKFVIGAGGSYAVDDTGGNASITLSTSQLPSHSHTATSTFTGSALGNHSHTATDSGHTHTYVSGAGSTNGLANGNWYSDEIGIKKTTNTSGTGTANITVASASAGTPSGTVATTVASTGSGAAVDIRNPYYALCYIMKV